MSQSQHHSQPPRRPLVRRRGSISAGDPFGTHAALNLDPNLSSSSTLTIVRIDPNQPSPGKASGPSLEPSLISPHKSRFHRRVSSAGSPVQTLSRLSFAFSSFSSKNAVA